MTGRRSMIVHSPGEHRRFMQGFPLPELRFYGPFDDSDAALEWARQALPHEEWKVHTLRLPESYGDPDEEY